MDLDMYDYSARHYDAALGRWFTVDPLAEKYYSISSYVYVANNPVKYIDPNGKWIESAWDVFSLVTGAKSFVGNVKAGNVVGAVVDGVGVLVDATALVVPGVPGGAGAGIKALRAGDRVVDAVTAGNKVDNAVDAAKTVDKTSDAKKTYQTYTKEPKNPADGVYSGRTSGKGTPEQNVANRDKNHHMNETHGPAKLDKSSSNPDAIRGREQQNIKSNGGARSQGGTSGNAINSVSPNNKNAQKYEQATKKEFGN